MCGGSLGEAAVKRSVMETGVRRVRDVRIVMAALLGLSMAANLALSFGLAGREGMTVLISSESGPVYVAERAILVHLQGEAWDAVMGAQAEPMLGCAMTTRRSGWTRIAQCQLRRNDLTGRNGAMSSQRLIPMAHAGMTIRTTSWSGGSRETMDEQDTQGADRSPTGQTRNG